jgi:hypothetical protein
MLSPITKKEKLQFTLKLQAEKGRDEILWQLIEENYTGLVDIWPVVRKTKKSVVLEVLFEKVKPTDELKNEKAIRYSVIPSKGVKIIK